MSHISHAPDVILTFFVKDNHCHPITKPELKQIAASCNQKGSVNLFQHMSEVKWTRRHDKFTKYADVNDQTKNSIIICPPEMKISTAVRQYSLTSGYYVEHLHFNNSGQLDSIIDHRGNMYVENNDYDTRKSICEQMMKYYNIHDFQWSNQGYTSLANSLFKMMNGYIPESSFNNKTREILDRFYPRALQWCSFGDIPEGLVNIDISKQFPSILINNSVNFPHYTMHEVFEKFNGTECELDNNGEFLIDEFMIQKFGRKIPIESDVYHISLIKYLIDELGMPLSNIKYKLIAKHEIEADTFKKFMLCLFNNFPEAHAKKLANSFIGDLGRKYDKTDYGFSCTELQTCQDVWTQALADDKNIMINKFDDMYLVREQKIERILSDHTSINRFVISCSILQCLQCLNANWTPQSEVFSINTDGFFMTNPKHRYRNKADVNFTVKNIGKAFITNSKADHFVKRYRDKFDINDFKDVISKTGEIYFGMPGCGKSWRLCKLIYENRDKCIVLSHTNRAVSNIKNILQANHKLTLEEVNKICHTFESFFYDNVRGIDDLKDKIVYVDEYTMTPNRYMTSLYQAFTKHDITVIMSGDNNQCDPINKNGLLHYDYFNDSISVSEMCPRIAEMKYIEGSTRYDKETKTILDNFLKYKNLRHKFKPFGEYYKNICYTNKTRRRVTAECCAKFVQEKDSHDVNFLYDSNIEKYNVCVCMPVIATTNKKKYEMYNMMDFEIEHINKDSNGVLIFSVNKQQFSIHEFKKSFLPNFCNTIYKYQGSTINEPYNIWDTEKMDDKEMYTSLSRTTKLEYIHLNNKKIRKR